MTYTLYTFNDRILTSTPELARTREAGDIKNQPRKRKKITKRNLNFDFEEDPMEVAKERRLEKEMKDNVSDSDRESFQSFKKGQVFEKCFRREDTPK